MTLWTDSLRRDGRAVHKWSHYFPAYERHLTRFVNRPVLLVEIGCGEGGSLQMWKRFLGPLAQIVGVDIRPECKAYQEEQVAVRIGNQGDIAFLDRLLAETGPPDIVIDDGSHLMHHLVTTFLHLYPRMDRNGAYVVEDLHTCYWPEFGGGLRREGSFMELCKHLLDELNADLSRGAVTPTGFSRSTLSMHFYDSLAVFERGRQLPKQAPIVVGSTTADPPPRPRPADPGSPA